jgi:hypothetical protein
VPDPKSFQPGRHKQSATSRPMEPFSDGIHHCFGREIALTFVCGMVKLVAGLKELRPAPGLSGQIKAIQVGTEKCFLNDTWSYLTFDPTSKSCLHSCLPSNIRLANSDFSLAAWKLHYAGTGKGTYKAVPKPAMNITQIEMQIGSKMEPDKH